MTRPYSHHAPYCAREARSLSRSASTAEERRSIARAASERLGHSGVAITLDPYSHVIPGMQENAAANLDRAFKAAIWGIRKPKG